MYNKVVLVGHLTRDVEMRYSQSGATFGKVGIATSRKWKSQTGEQKNDVMFVDLTFFARTAEIANQYLRKGSKVLVEGRLVLEQWTAQDGSKRSKHTVSVDHLTMLDTKADSQNLNHNNGYGDQPSQNNYGEQQQTGQNSYGGQQQPQNNYTRQQQPSQNSYDGGNNNNPNGYGNPQQQQGYAQTQPPQLSQQQTSGYNQPQVSEQPTYQAPPQQQKQQSVPEINIDEDEIPF
jgi:single-strand DNA-binding protein